MNSRGRQPTVAGTPRPPALKGPNSWPQAHRPFGPFGVVPSHGRANRRLPPTAIHVSALRAARQAGHRCGQPQRGWGAKPKVARASGLPWVAEHETPTTPTGLRPCPCGATTALRLGSFATGFPKVGAAAPTLGWRPESLWDSAGKQPGCAQTIGSACRPSCRWLSLRESPSQFREELVGGCAGHLAEFGKLSPRPRKRVISQPSATVRGHAGRSESRQTPVPSRP